METVILYTQSSRFDVDPGANQIVDLTNAVPFYPGIIHLSAGTPPAYIDLREDGDHIAKYPAVCYATITDNNGGMYYYVTRAEKVASAAGVWRLWLRPDYLTTYARKVIITSGRIRRVPVGRTGAHADRLTIDRVPTSMNNRSWTTVNSERLNKSDHYWAIMSFFDRDHRAKYIYWKTRWMTSVPIVSGSTTLTTPTIREMFEGALPDQMNIASENIIGVWLLPFNTLTDLPGSVYRGHEYADNVKMGAYMLPSNVAFSSYFDTVEAFALVTDDTHKGVILDPAGNVIYTVPRSDGRFGPIVGYAAYLDWDNMTPTLRLWWCDEDEWLEIEEHGVPAGYLAKMAAEGRACDIRGLAVPIYNSALSSYILSGQKEADEEIKRTQQVQSAGNILIGAAAGAAVGSLPGAIVGAAAGAVKLGLDVVATSQEQRTKEKLLGRAPMSILKTAGGWEWMGPLGLKGWTAAELEWDAESMAEYAAEVARMGCETDRSIPPSMPVQGAEFTEFGAGGWTIENATVKNNGGGTMIPPEAKSAIRDALAQGIMIR